MTKNKALKLALEALEKSHTCPLLPDDCAEAITAIKEALAQPEQEPVAWYRDEDGIRIYYDTECWEDATPLYTTPPQRKPLTDEEISELIRATHNTGSFVRAIEAKLKELNT